MEKTNRHTPDIIERLAERGEITPHTYRALKQMHEEGTLYDKPVDGVQLPNTGWRSTKDSVQAIGSAALGGSVAPAPQVPEEAPHAFTTDSRALAEAYGSAPPREPGMDMTTSATYDPAAEIAKTAGTAPLEPLPGGEDAGGGDTVVPPAGSAVVTGTAQSAQPRYGEETQWKTQDPAARAAQVSARENEARQIKLMGDMDAAALQEKHDIQVMSTLATNAQARAAQAAEMDRKRQMQQKFDEYQGALDDYRNTKIDSGKMFGDMGTGNKILAAIGLAMGAVGTSYTGGKNLASDVFERAIDRDIQVQKANLETKHNALGMQGGQLARFREMLGDDRAAEAAERNRIRNHYIDLMETAATGAASPAAQQGAQLAMAKAKTTQAKDDAVVLETLHTRKPLQEAAVKPRDAAPPEDFRRIGAYDDQARMLDHLEKIYNEIDSDSKGAVGGRLSGLYKALKVSGPNDTNFEKNLTDYAAKKATGQFGVPKDTELAMTKDHIMSLIQDPKTARALLKDERAQIASQATAERTRYGRYDLPEPTYDHSKNLPLTGRNPRATPQGASGKK